MLLAEALGLGAVAYGFMALGLAGFFNAWAFACWLAVLAAWARREAWDALLALLASLTRLGARWRQAPMAQRMVVIAGLILLALAFLQALAPPWDYDGLMYHLQGPRLFLGSGRIVLLPENWQANGPFTVEMLFSLGLAFGSDVFAKLVHVAYAAMLVLATFILGRRALGGGAGWVTVALLLGIPLFSFWASLAYIDMAWALYNTLTILCLVRWNEDKHRSDLVFAGLFAGLSAGTKYLGLGTALVCGLWLLWRLRGRSWRTVAGTAFTFGGLALAVALPWYVKNWIAAGNPIFPFMWGGPGWDKLRLSFLTDYLGSFGAGRTPLDFLLLPWNLFVHSTRFGTFMRVLEVPNALLILALLYPLARRTPAADAIAAMGAGGFLLWAVGSQQTRFLLPVFPALAVGAAAVLVRTVETGNRRRWRRSAGILLLAAPVAAAVFWSAYLMWYAQPLPVVLGLESKASFLQTRVPNYRAMEYIESRLAESTRVLMLWDGEGYYCDSRCLPDTDQSQMLRLASRHQTPEELAAGLHRQGVTHVLFSHDSDVFIEERDPSGHHRDARDLLLNAFLPSCASEVYADDWVALYALECAPSG